MRERDVSIEERQEFTNFMVNLRDGKLMSVKDKAAFMNFEEKISKAPMAIVRSERRNKM